ncbi:nucleotide-binding universal stress UspA family protein [Catenulispora sp. GP43]|jgi:nucleotide-binding universal stress UspA family protein|uniref:universal stress protein n=1 Tax=Catenulispora sp. GP43 TaxID=3156263 RepID=UPI003515511F
MRTTVVVGYDRTLPSGRALLEAGREAAYRDADITVVHVRRPDTAASRGTDAAEREASASTASFGAGVLRHHYPGLTIRAEALVGAPHEVLASAARGADLLVLGSTDSPDATGQMLGPVAEETLARTPCPTMVVRSGERFPRGVVLVAIDLAERAEEVVDFAFAEARFHAARLHAVSAVEPAELRALVGATAPAPDPRAGSRVALDRILAERQERCVRVQAGGEVVAGPPTSVLTAAAAGADLVVAGARRRHGEHCGERYGVRIGPVAQALLRGTACPVIIVPHS